jgi:hypothetical protein
MTHEELSAKLAEPFAANEIEWRVQSSGKTRDGRPWVRVLAYVDNRAIMERLDAVCGIAGWKNEYRELAGSGITCGLSIRVPRMALNSAPGAPAEVAYEWITKWDGADKTDIESTKGGLSNAMKRAAVQWRVGRYLYNLEEGYAIIVDRGTHGAEYLKANPQKHGDALYWRPPVLPGWALPGGSGNPDTPVAPRASIAPPDEPAPVKRNAADESKKQNSIGAHGTLCIPGTKAHFGGFGSKRIMDIATPDLVEVRKQLAGVKDAETKYRAVLDAIDITLDERRND